MSTTSSATVQVPFLDLRAQYQSIKAEIDTAIQAVVDSCAFAGGPFVGTVKLLFVKDGPFIRARILLNLYPSALAEGPDGLRKRDLLHRHDETESIPALPAPEALVYLLRRAYEEGRRLFIMKRTESLKVLSGAF